MRREEEGMKDATAVSVKLQRKLKTQNKGGKLREQGFTHCQMGPLVMRALVRPAAGEKGEGRKMEQQFSERQKRK